MRTVPPAHHRLFGRRDGLRRARVWGSRSTRWLFFGFFATRLRSEGQAARGPSGADAAAAQAAAPAPIPASDESYRRRRIPTAARVLLPTSPLNPEFITRAETIEGARVNACDAAKALR